MLYGEEIPWTKSKRSFPRRLVLKLWSWTIWRMLRRNYLKEWSGLSESNRHLNLGKVPYYHYTKAAYLTFLLYHADATSYKARRTGLFLTSMITLAYET